MGEPKVSVVIVDHHDTTRSVLRQVFEEQWGWSVVGEATLGTDAVGLARMSRPDVIVADAGITDMTVDELSRLVGPPSGPSVVVALLDFPHQYATGPESAVIKGVPMDHLKNVVLRTLRQAHPEDPRWAERSVVPIELAADPNRLGPPSPHLSGERVFVDLHESAAGSEPPSRRRRQRVGLLASLLGDEADEATSGPVERQSATAPASAIAPTELPARPLEMDAGEAAGDTIEAPVAAEAAPIVAAAPVVESGAIVDAPSMLVNAAPVDDVVVADAVPAAEVAPAFEAASVFEAPPAPPASVLM